MWKVRNLKTISIFDIIKVKCRKIEMMMPRLMKMVKSEMEGMKRRPYGGA